MTMNLEREYRVRNMRIHKSGTTKTPDIFV